MGYSIYVITPNQTVSDKLFDFLKTYMYKCDFIRLCKTGEGDTGLSYCQHRHKTVIGFDYNCGGYDREYAFLIVKWIAKTINKKCYYYDGERMKFKKVTPNKEELKMTISFQSFQDKNNDEDILKLFKSHIINLTKKYKHESKK